ncbi:MAG: acetoacetate--CoA ligase [Alphaproteobacteria bacterium]|nr:acetoacetate--CoA ligase [Alphaproteobacteria bacterium]
MNTPLWSPSQDFIEKTFLYQFKERVESKYTQKLDDYTALWQWSVANAPDFWDEIWDFCGVIGDKGKTTFDAAGGIMQKARFFTDSKLNYAENLLKHKNDNTAIIFRDEHGAERSLSFNDLHVRVSKWQQAMKHMGITKGDRVAGYMPNTPETIIAALAAISLGAIWSSASPDFGVQGVVDRFGQTQPKLLIAVDGYYYNGKTVDVLAKLKDVQPQIGSLERIVIVPFAGSNMNISDIPLSESEESFINSFEPKDVEFARVEFNHPLFIMFSSGTTGIPKCIVHGHGGTLLQHLKEHMLQCDVKPDDKVFYFTTCGWMMWNWLISALGCGATLLLFDGSPFYPDGYALWDYTSKHKCTLFGTSAKYIDAMKVNNIHPMDKYDLSSLRTITSTGSPLVHEGFDFVYEHIKKDVHLASIYGGTDIISASFGIGNPISPVYRGEIQGPALATDVDIFDENGQPKPPGSGPGELVCKQPIPSMPVSFWNDADGSRYESAYYKCYPDVWHHGDWVEKTVHNGFIIHGRSDATLNPGGVRIGTAEIYRQVEQVEAVKESICVGQNWDGDVRVILFIVLKDGWDLDDNLIKEIKAVIRNGASPRHVPAKIIAVSDIPRTRSGKITEIAVRDIIHGRAIKNIEALANPEALEEYKDLEALKA